MDPSVMWERIQDIISELLGFPPSRSQMVDLLNELRFLSDAYATWLNFGGFSPWELTE